MHWLKVLSILLLLGVGLPIRSQDGEKDSLRENMFSIGALGLRYDYQIDASKFTIYNREQEGVAWGRGVVARWDKALMDAGSGIGAGVSYLQMDGATDHDRSLDPSKKVDQAYRLHLGYFTRVHPFRWSPYIKGGFSKLRFEFAYGSPFRKPLLPRPSRGNLLFFASYHYARPLFHRTWMDFGVGAGIKNENNIRAGWTFELSLALMIRSGERAPYP